MDDNTNYSKEIFYLEIFEYGRINKKIMYDLFFVVLIFIILFTLYCLYKGISKSKIIIFFILVSANIFIWFIPTHISIIDTNLNITIESFNEETFVLDNKQKQKLIYSIENLDILNGKVHNVLLNKDLTTISLSGQEIKHGHRNISSIHIYILNSNNEHLIDIGNKKYHFNMTKDLQDFISKLQI